MSAGMMMHHLVDVVLAAEPAKSGGFTHEVVAFFKEGGPFMFINIFWLAAALAVVVERTITLMFRYNLNAAPFMEQITKLVMAGNVDRAVKLCGAAPNSPLAKVVRAGLTRANRGEIEVAKALEESILENNPHISARIQWLWSLANIATLVGLVGTVFGLIGTFKSLGNVPADQKQALLSKGISEAMNNTFFGLSIAVICIIAHLFLTAYARNMIETVELNAMKLENLLGRRAAGETSAMDFEKAS
ncbi:MAG: MotA/TolQ/ExbB proton channel family protein [Myxococcota bacterium]